MGFKFRFDEKLILYSLSWIFLVRAITGSVSVGYLVDSFINDLLGWTYIFVVLGLLALGFSMIIRSNETYNFGRKSLYEVARSFRDLLPLMFLGYIFYSVGGDSEITHTVGFSDVTNHLIYLEELLFSFQTTLISDYFSNPFLTDYFSFIYMFYPWIIIFTALILRWWAPFRIFRGYMTSIVLASCIAFVFFVLLPTTSPTYILSYDTQLTGPYFTAKFHEKIDFARSRGNDCCLFPSLHVALSTIPWLYLRRYKRKLDKPVFFLAISEWVSTVYLRRHFSVDVVGGLILGYLAYMISERYTFENLEDETDDEDVSEMTVRDAFDVDDFP